MFINRGLIFTTYQMKHRCEYYISKTGRKRRCKHRKHNKRYNHRYCKQHLDMLQNNLEIGLCCFCGEECNPCSQSCGTCARSRTIAMLAYGC